MFARLLREHNADHSAGPEEEASEVEAPTEAMGAAPSGPVLLRADTADIARRAATELLAATGRSGGDTAVQQARLAAAPTFVRKDAGHDAEDAAEGVAAVAGEGEAAVEEEQGGGAGAIVAARPGEKYGRQLRRFETMIQQTKGKGGGKVRWRSCCVPRVACVVGQHGGECRRHEAGGLAAVGS